MSKPRRGERAVATQILQGPPFHGSASSVAFFRNLLGNLQHNFSKILAIQQQMISISRAFHR
jgi:hypothetical protein